MKTINNLVAGETLLVSVKGTANGVKVGLEFAEIISSGTSSNGGGNSIVSAFNQADEKFVQAAKPRRAYLYATNEDVQRLLDIDVSDINANDVEDLNILNPSVNGNRLRVQIEETVSPTEWQATNIEKAAKRAGKDGKFITSKGNYIFTNATVVDGEASHTFLASDAPVAKGIKAIKAPTAQEVAQEELAS